MGRQWPRIDGRLEGLGAQVIASLLAALARLLGPVLPFVATWFAARHDARQSAEIGRLHADMEAKDKRHEIENEIAAEPDLVRRAVDAGILRKSVK